MASLHEQLVYHQLLKTTVNRYRGFKLNHEKKYSINSSVPCHVGKITDQQH